MDNENKDTDSGKEISVANVIALLTAVIWAASKVHYTAKGADFYGWHLLADRVRGGLQDEIDSLKEVYFMGEVKTDPPEDWDTAQTAHGIIEAASSNSDNAKGVLLNVLLAASRSMQDAPKNVSRGTSAIFDDISKSFMTSYALVSHNV